MLSPSTDVYEGFMITHIGNAGTLRKTKTKMTAI